MELILPIINNIGLLALAALVYTATPRTNDGINPLARALILGLGLGCTSAAVMLVPIPFAPGVFYDSRGGPLLMSGILGGPVAAIVTAIPPILMRASIGGIGMIPGIVGILTASACSIVAWWILRHRKVDHVFLPLIAYAATAALISLPATLLIADKDLAWSLLAQFAPIVILVNVASVTVLGLIISVETRRRNMVATLQKSEASAREALAVRNRFIAMMSHEVRTPLNAILGYAQLLRDETLTPQQTDRINRLSASAKTLLRLIDEILHFSQYQGQPIDLTVERCALPALVNEALETVRADAGRKGLDLRLSSSGVPNVVIEIDAPRLRRCLVNTLSNAVKFTERGHVEVAASLETGDDGERLRITVSDTGVGIDSDRLELIFEPFERQATPGVPGSGLGMAIVRAAAEAMGGSVSITSTRNVGTSVVLDIPTTAHGPVSEPIRTETPGDYAPAHDGVRILVVDDIEINADIACAFLAQIGCQTAVAANGSDAVQAVRDSTFDAVLMDIEMPVMDGLEATRAIRGPSTSEPARSVPIVALTAYASRADMLACLEAGMNGYLSKPVDKDALFAALARVGALTAAAAPPGEPATNTAVTTLPAGVDGTPAFSQERYDALAELVPAETLQMVLQQASVEIESLGAQIAAPAVDLEDKRQALHKMVSIAGNIGLLQLSALSRHCQETIRNGGTIGDTDTSTISAAIDHALAKISELQSPPSRPSETHAD